MLGIAIRCIQHSQAMLERRVRELAHSFFHLMIVFMCAFVGIVDTVINTEIVFCIVLCTFYIFNLSLDLNTFPLLITF